MVSDKLPEEGLGSELQKGGLSWLSMFKKPMKRKQFGVLESMLSGAGVSVNWGLGADLLLAVRLVLGKSLFSPSTSQFLLHKIG